VEAVEEVDDLVARAARTMTGANDLTVYELPEDRLRDILRKYNRLQR